MRTSMIATEWPPRRMVSKCQAAVSSLVNVVLVGSQRLGDHGVQPDMIVCDQHTEGSIGAGRMERCVHVTGLSGSAQAAAITALWYRSPAVAPVECPDAHA